MFRLTVVCLLAALAQVAFAQTSVDVAVIGGQGADAYSMRLVAELRAAGLQAQTYAWQSGSLEEVARERNAAAATRPLPSGQGVEVWMDERATGRPMLRHLVVDERPQGPDVTMIVLQTAELLRAGLRGQPPPTSAISDKPKARPTAAVEPLGIWLASAGLGMAAQTGGFTSTAIGRVGLGYQSPSGWGPELLWQWPWQAARLSTLEGTTQAKLHLLALGLRWGGSRGAFHHVVSAGVVGQWSRLQGIPGPGLQSQQTSDIGLGGFARAATGLHMTSWLRLSLEALALLRASSTRVVHAGREVGAHGRFGLAGLVSFEVLWR